MPALTRSRRLARLVAAWVLLWFAALQVTALLTVPAPQPVAGHAAHAAQDCEEEHAHHGGAGHAGAGHLVQCPGCLFSAAPPPQDFAPLACRVAAPAVAAAPRAGAPRGEPLAQPPARGPPRFS